MSGSDEQKAVGGGISPSLRVLGLSGTLTAASVPLLAAAMRLPGGPARPFSISWWALVPLVVAAEALMFHIELRKQTHSFTLSEIPLVVGLFFMSPIALLTGRLVGNLIYRCTFGRQSPLKVLFNLSSSAAEVATALVVFRAVDVGHSPLSAMAGVAVFAAVAVADTAGLVAVNQAIRWYGGEPKIADLLSTGAVTTVINTGLSVLAVITLWVSPWAAGILLVLAVTFALGSRTYVGLRQRYSSLQLLYEFTRVVGSSLTAEAVMDEVLGEARKLLRAARAEVYLVEASGETMAPEVRRLSNLDADASVDSVPESALIGLLDEDVWTEVMEKRAPLAINRGSRVPSHRRFLAAIDAEDCLVAPLLSDGEPAGAIIVADRMSNVTSFDEQDLQLFATLANHANVAFENSRLVQKLRQEAEDRRHEARHDSLTGLANRTLFQSRVTHLIADARPGRSPAAVMLMDLDRFKDVNDTLGHHNGDLLLQEVANRLTRAVRTDGTVARLGGDEFAILLPHIASEDEAIETANRIVEALKEPLSLDELAVEVGASIGIAIWPQHGDDSTMLLQRADVAMYEAKSSDDSIALYSPERDHNTTRRLTMAADLRRAIPAGELQAYYQPKARLSDGVVTSVEALVRWQHPDRGFIHPDDFIPTAEETGLIAPLTRMMLEASLAQCRAWRDTGYDLGVSVNLAVRSLLDTELPRTIEGLLAEFGVPGDRLTLEITESGVMADPTRTIAVLERLAAIGVKLSVDDFGTGYSSLSYLRRLPVHEVKVDKSFVFRMATDAGDAAIVQSIIELGHNLGLSTVAEGVEDSRIWGLLRDLGCDDAQGYYISKPHTAEEITAWLDSTKRYRRIEPGASSAAQVSVLLIDDDPALRHVVRALLESDGRYAVHEAADGWEGIAMARKFQPEMILLDLVMPTMSGLDTLPSIRAVAPDSRVLVLSSLDDSQSIETARRGGAIGRLDKASGLDTLPDYLGLLLAA